jgi:hypothetical protein
LGEKIDEIDFFTQLLLRALSWPHYITSHNLSWT